MSLEDEADDAIQFMEELSPELEELVKRYSPDKYQAVLVAIGSFAVYYVGKFFGVEIARDFAQSMADRAYEIDDDDELGPKFYDA